MSNRKAVFGQMLWARGRRGESPLAPIARQYLPYLPLLAALGFFASALEGVGIGLLIPLLALLLSGAIPADIPEPIRALAALAESLDVQTRILALGAAVFALIALKGVVQALSSCLVAYVEGRIGRDVRNALADRLLSLNYPFFLENDLARLSRILSNDSWFVTEAARWALAMIPAAVSILIFSVLLAWLNLTLFGIALVGAIVIQGAVLLFERRQHRLSAQLTASDLSMWERMLALVTAMRVIRLFGQERFEHDRFAEKTELVRHSFSASRYVLAFATPTVESLTALLFVVILLSGYATGMSIPAITAFLVLLSRAQPQARAIAESRLGIATVRGSIHEVEWLLSQKPSNRPAPIQRPDEVRLDKAISFEGVSFVYPNGGKGVEDLTLVIRPGVATALIGPSGSGKTTLVNLLARLIEPAAGRLCLGGTPVDSIDPDSWRRPMAVAGQDVELVAGSVAENIAYGRPGADRSEVEDAARTAGASGFILGLPQGYDTQVGAEGVNLSGGQRQRIGLARALLRKPDLLVLDEATNAVDALSENEIMKLLREHRHFRTALVISHRKSTLAACEDGIVIRDGRILEAGPLSSLSYFRTMAGDANPAE